MAESKLKIDVRRNKILELLHASGRISVNRLSQLLKVTQVTVRNDLTCLEQEGKLLRCQGGATLLPEPAHAPAGEEIAQEPAKRAIGTMVSQLIRDSDTLFINSGTTTACVAEALRSKMDLNVVTNSLAVASVDNQGAVGGYFTVNGEKIVYTEYSGFGNRNFASLDTDGTGMDFEFLFLDTYGTEADYENGSFKVVKLGYDEHLRGLITKFKNNNEN